MADKSSRSTNGRMGRGITARLVSLSILIIFAGSMVCGIGNWRDGDHSGMMLLFASGQPDSPLSTSVPLPPRSSNPSSVVTGEESRRKLQADDVQVADETLRKASQYHFVLWTVIFVVIALIWTIVALLNVGKSRDRLLNTRFSPSDNRP